MAFLSAHLAEVFVYPLGPRMGSVHREGGCFPMAELFFGLGRPQEKLKHVRVWQKLLRLSAEYLNSTEPSCLLQLMCGPCPVSWMLTCLCLPGETAVKVPHELLFTPPLQTL